MRKILFLMIFALIMAGCKSREEKVAEVIKQEMFKTLYDFESYEPIETKIDSAFTSIYTDTLALLYANEVSEMFNELDDAKMEYESAKSTMEIWSDSYSSLGVYKFNEAKKKVNDYIEKIDKQLIYHTQKGEFKERKNMKDAYMEFEPYDFLRIHSSYLVNMRYITKIDSDSVYLQKIALPFARNRKQEVRRKMESYIHKK